MIAHPPPRTTEPTELVKKTPPLQAGDRLSRAEFERRYRNQPDLKKAELLEGIVYMPSPVKYSGHAHPHLFLNTWLGTYVAATPGVEGGDNATLRLDDENEPQPDILLRVDLARGGKSFVGLDDYLVGAPELIVEVAATSANYDMHIKKRVYARNGVQEYLVALTPDHSIYWFVLDGGEYRDLQPDAEGILRSRVFPGLWLNSSAFWASDLREMLATLERGLVSPEHIAFAARLLQG